MKATAMLCLLLAICALPAVPMAGTYVIGGESCDFFTLQGAIDTLETLGASDDVTFELSPGTYEGPFVLNQGADEYQLIISSGLHTASEVVFTNPNATSTENYIFYLNGTDNVYFDDMKFMPTGTYSRCIVVYGDADNLTFRNNYFVYESVSSWNSEAIYFNANGSADADNITIEVNSFVSGGYHIYTNSSSTLTHYTGWTIRYNGHLGGYCGVSLNSATNMTLVGEDMFDVNTGIYMQNCSGDLLLTNNRINAYAAGMSLSYVTAYASDTPHVYNNVITVNGYNWYGGYGSVDANGLGLSSCTNVYAAHNSVCNTSASTNSLAGSVSGANNILRKNQFVSLGAGAGYYAYNVGSSGTNIVEYNNIYSHSANIGRSQNTVYHEIDDFNALCDGVNLDFQPFFTDDTLHTAAPRLNNFGPACNVAVDFDGNPRSTTAPDLGAFEYDPDPAMTPLEGELTVGAGGNYATLGDLAYALAFRGVNAPVTAVLTDSLYEEQFTMERIPGIGGDRVLTITAPEGQYPVISYSGQTATNNYVMDVYRTQYVIWRNLIFQTTATGYSNLVRLNGFLAHGQFDNCEFHAPLNPGTVINATSLGSTDNAALNELSVIACDFYGNTVGMNLQGTAVTIGSNYMQDQYIGINGYLLANSLIAGNGLVNCSYWGLLTNGGSNLNVVRNSITGSGGGMAIENCSAGEERTLIANNLIHLTGNRVGIQTSGTDIDVLCNSVWTEGTNGRGLYAYYFPTNCTIQNNIFAAPQGLAAEFAYYTPSDDKVLDYNCYYTESNSLLRMGATYVNLASAQIAAPECNAHSMSLYPYFTEDMHTGSPWLRGTGINCPQVTVDYDNDPRIPISDIGADQQTGAHVGGTLSGEYTVGISFPTIDAFIEAVSLRGIQGDVILNIPAGVYSGYYTLRDIPKTSPDLAVTFRGLGNVSFVLDPVNNQGYDNYAFSLLGADNVTLSNLDFEVATSTHTSYLITTTGRCDNLRFDQCTFTTSNNYDHAVNTGSSVSDNLAMEQCSVTGFAYGLVVNGEYGNSNVNRGVTLRNCSMENNGYTVFLNRVSGMDICGNTITGVSLRGIDISGYGTATDTQRICNNYIELTGNSAIGLRSSYLPNAEVFFNTFDTASAPSGIPVYFEYNCPGLTFADNLCSSATNTAAYFYTSADIARLDHNLFHTNGTTVVQVGSSVAGTIEQYEVITGDTTSIFADPLLGEDYHTLAGSPAINGGVAITGIDEDIEGNLRTVPDMGCWEYQVLSLSTPQNVRIAMSGDTAVLSWDAVTGATMYRVYQSANYPATSWTTQDVSGTTLQVPVSSGYRYFKVTALDGR